MHYATLQLKSSIYAQKWAVSKNATCFNNCTAKRREGTKTIQYKLLMEAFGVNHLKQKYTSLNNNITKNKIW